MEDMGLADAIRKALVAGHKIHIEKMAHDGGMIVSLQNNGHEINYAIRLREISESSYANLIAKAILASSDTLSKFEQ
jgi:hypothetical protein